MQLEITQHGDPPHVPEPHPENQLVLYLRGVEARDAAVRRLVSHGHRPVQAANPYWPERGAVLFPDPDGWLIVLAPWVFGRDAVPAPGSIPLPDA
jgi:hypothetical protein